MRDTYQKESYIFLFLEKTNQLIFLVILICHDSRTIGFGHVGACRNVTDILNREFVVQICPLPTHTQSHPTVSHPNNVSA